ncbi:cyclin-dependent kinases regulatory subunit 1-like isoform X1 [Venturia canescens]|uniref:cyclin-dependent kinases regulatory subunit 1-like isoform X1 n=1 Tax=Venturia canescens TaxID=32260 RepID=UPI001C9C4B48|nr:cyclin-dependent kinases regulatory subunit 1-like isoform X1 [Venturia canescens]
MSNDTIQYSDKYNDDKYEYRHVILPADLAKLVPKSHLMTETEWRNLGVQQSPRWVHYMMHGPGNKKWACTCREPTSLKPNHPNKRRSYYFDMNNESREICEYKQSK